MSLQDRLKELAIKYDTPLDEVKKRYDGRYNALKQAYGLMYKDRESHLSFYAYKGTELALKFHIDKYKK